MDMINAAAFGFEDDLSVTRGAINHLTSSPVKVKDNAKASEPVDFAHPDVPAEISSLRDTVHFLGTQIVSPLPRYTYWYRILTNSKIRHQLAAKDELIKAQLTKSLKRLESGDETLISATDYMIQREYSVAKKEGRAPDFYSRRTIDEVGRSISYLRSTRLTLHSLPSFLGTSSLVMTRHQLRCPVGSPSPLSRLDRHSNLLCSRDAQIHIR